MPHPAYEGFRSAIVAPMRWAGEVKGILGVGTRDPAQKFTPAQADLLEAFATLAALGSATRRASRSARARRGSARLLPDRLVLGEPISLEETLDALAQAASEALGGSSAAVLMPLGDDLRLAGLHNLPGLLVNYLEDGLGHPSGRCVPAPAASACSRRRASPTTTASTTTGGA